MGNGAAAICSIGSSLSQVFANSATTGGYVMRRHVTRCAACYCLPALFYYLV